MNQSIPLYSVLIAAAVAAGIWAVLRWVRALENSAQRSATSAGELAEAVRAATATLSALNNSSDDLREALEAAPAVIVGKLSAEIAPALGEVRAHLAGVPAMLEGLARVSSAQLDILNAQRAAAMEKERNPFGGRTNSPFTPKDATAADMEYEISERMKSGMTREQAMMEMNTANADSVWAGNSMFTGWGGR